MKYPLNEKIGDPNLLCGREKEFSLLDKWLARIPKKIGKSRAILARRKSGKTAIVQRIFNRLWSENGIIVPFYFAIPETKKWLPEFAIEYYGAFVSQYISFMERDEKPVDDPLSLEEIREYGVAKSIDLIINDVDSLLKNDERGHHGLMWKTACTAPERFASIYSQRILVIIDEFQNIAQFIYRDATCKTKPDETLAGSFHDVVESKISPMLVTGSYVGWLIMLIDKYMEGGRLKRQFMSPCLPPEEGLQAIYKYAQIYDVPITNQTAEQINRLCMSDPFFISCVIQSEYEEHDLTTREGVISTVDYEIRDRSSEMSMTWGEYIEQTIDKVNERYAKSMLLHLSKHADRDWTHRELQKKLGLDLAEDKIREKLEIMVKADLIDKGDSDMRYRGLQDGTLDLILRHRFEEEINDFIPDLKKEFNDEIEKLEKEKGSLHGRLNNLVGKFAEFQLMTEFRTKKRFPLSVYFTGVKDKTKLNIINTSMRYKFQRPDGKEMEIDVIAESDCNRVILTEVKKTEKKTGLPVVRNFYEKVCAFKKSHPDKKVLPAFLSVGGFTKGALEFCGNNSIGIAEKIAYS